MKKILTITILILSSIFAFSQPIDKDNLPAYYVSADGDTLGILLSIEQVQKLDNDGELLKLFELLSIKCDSLDTYYVAVINKMNDKIELYKLETDNLNKQIKEKDDMIDDLKLQVKNRQENIDFSDMQLVKKDSIITDLNKDLEKQKLKSIVGWTGTGLFAAITIFLSIMSAMP